MGSVPRPRRTSRGPKPVIALLIKALREKVGLTQQELASKIGISQSALADYELGRSSPPTQRLSSLAEALGVTEAYLLRGQAALVSAQDQTGPANQAAKLPVQQPPYSETTDYDEQFERLAEAVVGKLRKTTQAFDITLVVHETRVLWRKARSVLFAMPISSAVDYIIWDLEGNRDVPLPVTVLNGLEYLTAALNRATELLGEGWANDLLPRKDEEQPNIAEEPSST